MIIIYLNIHFIELISELSEIGIHGTACGRIYEWGAKIEAKTVDKTVF